MATGKNLRELLTSHHHPLSRRGFLKAMSTFAWIVTIELLLGIEGSDRKPPPPSGTTPDIRQILEALQRQDDPQLRQLRDELIHMARQGHKQLANEETWVKVKASLEGEKYQEILPLLGLSEETVAQARQHTEQFIARLDNQYPGWRASVSAYCPECLQTWGEGLLTRLAEVPSFKAQLPPCQDWIGFIICAIGCFFGSPWGWIICIILCYIEHCLEL
ncbi:MAG: hypothetical protein ACE5MB_02865 [Anaerolineae bacterium]